MTGVETEDRRRRGAALWVLALAVVVTDAAVWFVGVSYGLLGMVVAIAVILWTQRKVDGYWRAHDVATND